MTIPFGDPRTYQVIGAAMEVHRTLHRGYLARIYCDALAGEEVLHPRPVIEKSRATKMVAEHK